MKSLDDISLITKVVLFKNNTAFDKLVKKYQSPVRRYLMHLTGGNAVLSDDLAQDTFLKAYVKLSTFRNMSGFSTWLFCIARNVFYDYIRAYKTSVNIEEHSGEVSEIVLQPDTGLKMDVYRALQILKEEERSCISLFYIEDLSIKQVSVVMNCPEGTVKSLLHRGKEKLSVYLKENGYGDEFRRR